MTQNKKFANLQYLQGFDNHFETEVLQGAIPKGQNNPQKCKYNLYAEQLSGTAFTLPRHKNKRTWLYRMLPSAVHEPFKKVDQTKRYKYLTNDFSDKNTTITPNQLRWKPLQHPKEKVNFVEGLVTISGSGDTSTKSGIAIYLYGCNDSMVNKAFYTSDGDLLIVPQQGTLYVTTECGKLTVGPQEIIVIPRGIKFSVEVEEQCRGWMAQVFKGHFQIPDLGPIGANGLANPRDFQAPVAYYENISTKFTIISKFMGEIYECEQNHSCFDVVGWHGNYYPCKYDLRLYNAMNTVTFDHPDPSIFTVLTCQSDEAGTAILDFVVFPPRWMVAEHTFRPPYYHRNTMSEFMGNIIGTYDAKEEGFSPGASSLHLPMTAHGPETDVFIKASDMELKPVRYPDNSLAFMFETSLILRTTKWVMNDEALRLDKDYYKCWQKLPKAKL